MMAVLVAAESGATRRREYHLRDSPCVLGRAPDCDIRLDRLEISRHHCRFFFAEPHHFVEDLDSRYGTYVNEELVEEPRQLNPGDRVRICDVTFSFQRIETN